jgi:hypothetical protein
LPTKRAGNNYNEVTALDNHHDKIMQSSNEIKNLTGALAIFHQHVGKIKKDATNPHFKSTYATLPSVLDAIAGPLATAGLFVAQMPTGDGGLTTRIVHAESGEYMQDTMVMKTAAGTPQAFGSAITYARRYALCAALSLSVGDDDGTEGSKLFAPDGAAIKRLLAAVSHERIRAAGNGACIMVAALKMANAASFANYLTKIETANQAYQDADAANPQTPPLQ